MRILLLTRHYPPEASGGSRRPSALAAGLRELGHNVLVIAPDGSADTQLLGVPHPVFPALDSNNSDDGTKDTRVLDWVRRWLLLPDPEIRWAMRAARAATSAAFHPDWIITTSPPESVHVVGAILKRKLGAYWLADVRDLWLQSPQRNERTHPLRAWVEKQLARWCLSKADALVAVSPIVLDEAQELAGKRPLVSGVIGHFAKPFDGVPHLFPTQTFNIVHTGSIGLSNPLSSVEPLVAAFEELVQQRHDAHLWMVGRLTEAEIARLTSCRARHHITVVGSVPMDQARAMQAGGDALAIVSGPNSHALPGKFSEYATSGAPVLLAGTGPWLALVPPQTAMPFAQALALKKRELPSKNLDLGFDQRAAASAFLALMESITLGSA